MKSKKLNEYSGCKLIWVKNCYQTSLFCHIFFLFWVCFIQTLTLEWDQANCSFNLLLQRRIREWLEGSVFVNRSCSPLNSPPCVIALEGYRLHVFSVVAHLRQWVAARLRVALPPSSFLPGLQLQTCRRFSHFHPSFWFAERCCCCCCWPWIYVASLIQFDQDECQNLFQISLHVVPALSSVRLVVTVLLFWNDGHLLVAGERMIFMAVFVMFLILGSIKTPDLRQFFQIFTL